MEGGLAGWLDQNKTRFEIKAGLQDFAGVFLLDVFIF